MPHRPPVPRDEIVVFVTLEDETGLAQVTVPPKVYECWGNRLLTEQILTIRGQAMSSPFFGVISAPSP
jgi:aspartyl/asparaginyl-tRNA synthetase